MPGIAGIINLGRQAEAATTARQMVDSMLHEPSYTSGTLADETLGVHAGWVCHGGSYADCLPIWNERRDICLLFTGEHFADPAESGRLRAGQHTFADGDASGLVHLYEEHGPEFFRLLNGTFSGLLIDRRENKVVLFNDRFGLGRIYFHETAGAFYFASEAKALLRVRPGLRELDLRSLGELLVCGCTLQDRTIFPGIALQPAGSAWIFPAGQPVRKEQYFDWSAWEAQAPMPAGDYYEELKKTFDAILPRYFQGRQKVALSLTGGLDSRMIIAGAAAAPGQLPCYTFGGMYRDSEDVKIARVVARLCRQPHDVIRVDQRFFPNFLSLARRCVYITDGAMDVSGAVGLYVNRLGREFGPVRMTGNYGSEILRESVAFKAGRLLKAAFSGEMTPFFDQAAGTYREEKQSCRLLSFITRKQMPWHHYSRLAEEQSQLTIRAPYLDNDLVPLAYRAPVGLLLNKQLAYRYTTEVQPALAGAPTDRGLLDCPPFIPKKLFGFLKELRPKAEYAYDYGMPQWLAKADRLLAPLHVERLFLGQQKYYHFRIWYRQALASQVREVLLDPRTLGRPYFDRRKVEAMVHAHTRGTGNHTSEIHRLMTCELIERELLGR